uniref:Uncharacterized protein n=1 Tax=Anguilla anguilla TaxID=7936 RepID=A0A0E9SBH8_ANGAN
MYAPAHIIVISPNHRDLMYAVLAASFHSAVAYISSAVL